MWKATLASMFLASVTAVASPSFAQEPSEDKQGVRPILWDKVQAGMTIDEVRQLYPRQGRKVKWHGSKQTEVEDVEILPGCEAEVEIQHASGTVDAVKVKGKGSLGGRCTDKVFEALSGKYGQPATQRDVQESILARSGEISVWSRDGVAMRFKRYTDGAFGGGGFGAASWELTYRSSASEISL